MICLSEQSGRCGHNFGSCFPTVRVSSSSTLAPRHNVIFEARGIATFSAVLRRSPNWSPAASPCHSLVSVHRLRSALCGNQLSACALSFFFRVAVSCKDAKLRSAVTHAKDTLSDPAQSLYDRVAVECVDIAEQLCPTLPYCRTKTRATGPSSLREDHISQSRLGQRPCCSHHSHIFRPAASTGDSPSVIADLQAQLAVAQNDVLSRDTLLEAREAEFQRLKQNIESQHATLTRQSIKITAIEGRTVALGPNDPKLTAQLKARKLRSRIFRTSSSLKTFRSWTSKLSRRTPDVARTTELTRKIHDQRSDQPINTAGDPLRPPGRDKRQKKRWALISTGAERTTTKRPLIILSDMKEGESGKQAEARTHQADDEYADEDEDEDTYAPTPQERPMSERVHDPAFLESSPAPVRNSVQWSDDAQEQLDPPETQSLEIAYAPSHSRERFHQTTQAIYHSGAQLFDQDIAPSPSELGHAEKSSSTP
ncbi:hypothetical protein D6C76_05386 [Aureobasidium pullulans]|nr:hypothetical protein D6C76_05386 [Aureobasidium pullulans]